MIDEHLLQNTELMKDMLFGDSPKCAIPKSGKQRTPTLIPAEYGPAIKLYSTIVEESDHLDQSQVSSKGILYRLALAVALEHAACESIQLNDDSEAENENENNDDNVDKFDPVLRYMNYELAYVEGKLDPYFDTLTIWDLRHVVNGDEPDEIADWGRNMLRNYYPDMTIGSNYGNKYVSLVNECITYGSKDTHKDLPDLNKYQNILMNGGVCGRRAFFGRFILRAFGMPTTARPSRGHGALLHWTPNEYWSLSLGRWAKNRNGHTLTRYYKDTDFYYSGKARCNEKEFWKVKRCQWWGDVMGEERVYGKDDSEPLAKNFWYGMSIKIQNKIVDQLPAKIDPLPYPPTTTEGRVITLEEKITANPPGPESKQVSYDETSGVITIPAAGYQGKKNQCQIMLSFLGGYQVWMMSQKELDTKRVPDGKVSHCRYTLNIPQENQQYSLVVKVVTCNFDQKLSVAVDGGDGTQVIDLPMTLGDWKDTSPITITFQKKGQNTLRVWRENPPFDGISIKSITLTPI